MGSPPQAALILGLCRMLKDRHDLHQMTLGIIPAHIRDAPFKVGRDDEGHTEGGRAARSGRLFCPGLGRPVVPRTLLETGRHEETAAFFWGHEKTELGIVRPEGWIIDTRHWSGQASLKRQLSARLEQAELILQAALDHAIARRAKKGEFVTCLDHFDLLQTARN